MLSLTVLCWSSKTYVEDRPDHHPMPLLQTPIIALREARTQFLILVGQIDPKSKSGKLESSKKPHEPVSRRSVFGV